MPPRPDDAVAPLSKQGAQASPRAHGPRTSNQHCQVRTAHSCWSDVQAARAAAHTNSLQQVDVSQLRTQRVQMLLQQMFQDGWVIVSLQAKVLMSHVTQEQGAPACEAGRQAGCEYNARAEWGVVAELGVPRLAEWKSFAGSRSPTTASRPWQLTVAAAQCASARFAI